jgi:ribosomal protein S18 acetylase RimI-like enzyme
MDALKVRPLDPNEAQSVVELWRLADATPSVTDRPEHVRRAAGLDRVAFLVAEQDGLLVGTIIATFDGWRGNIYRLAVHPAHRRRGVARRLVAAAEEAFARWGARRMTALVVREHDRATAFWKAVGYREEPRFARFIRNVDAGA